MLTITGVPVQRQSYTRVPMADAIGPVTAYVHQTYVHYRPKGGTPTEQHVRAQIIASTLGGRVITRSPEEPRDTVYLVEVTF